jgi:hypothetical protein
MATVQGITKRYEMFSEVCGNVENLSVADDWQQQCMPTQKTKNNVP